MRRVATYLLFVIPFLITSIISAASLPSQISYQGRIEDAGGAAVNGMVDLTMRIYRQSAGGTAIWSETHTGVSVDNGLFAVQLGSVTPIPTTVWTDQPDSVFLGVQVGADPDLLYQRHSHHSPL